MTPRERFAAILANGPLRRADAAVLMTGDGDARVPTAIELFRQQAAPVLVVTGGFHEPPYALSAGMLAGKIYGAGISPERVVVESAAKNTREQAVNVVAMARKRGWKSLLLVASPYHQYRAFLSFVQALIDAKLDERIRLTAVPCGDLKWFACPDGEKRTRVALLEDEFKKITDYQAKGHVASFTDGLKYLAYWEAK